jgi:hemerythrin superfamily protein
MNAIELLERDHTRIRTLFSDLENAKDTQELKESFEKLDNVLTLHARAEEEVLYPHSTTCKGTEELIQHGLQDHHRGDEMIAQIKSISADQPEFKKKVSELQELMETHLAEEENELFPKVRECLSPEEQENLASELTETKSELAEEVLDKK